MRKTKTAVMRHAGMKAVQTPTLVKARQAKPATLRMENSFKSGYSPRVSIHLDGVGGDDLNEIAGMLRGLMCSIEGWGSISGLTNDRFSAENPLKLEFSSVEKAHYFKSCVERYFDRLILKDLKVKKRIYRSRQ